MSELEKNMVVTTLKRLSHFFSIELSIKVFETEVFRVVFPPKKTE